MRNAPIGATGPAYRYQMPERAQGVVAASDAGDSEDLTTRSNSLDDPKAAVAAQESRVTALQHGTAPNTTDPPAVAGKMAGGKSVNFSRTRSGSGGKSHRGFARDSAGSVQRTSSGKSSEAASVAAAQQEFEAATTAEERELAHMRLQRVPTPHQHNQELLPTI